MMPRPRRPAAGLKFEVRHFYYLCDFPQSHSTTIICILDINLQSVDTVQTMRHKTSNLLSLCMHQQLELLLQVNARNFLSLNHICSKPSLAGFNISLSVGQLKFFCGYTDTFIECAIAG